MRWLFVLIVVCVIVYFIWGRDESSAPPEASPQQAAPAGSPAAPPAAPTPDLNLVLPRLQAVARQAAVDLRGWQFQPPKSLVLSLAWKGGNAAQGGDFLDECRKQGLIADINVDSNKPGMALEGGQQVFTEQIQVYLP